MTLTVLASGSKANAAVLEVNSHRYLIDAGLSAAQIERRMALAGIEPNTISAAFLTHEHADHCAGIARWVWRWPMPVYANAMTAQAINGKGVAVPWHIFRTGESFEVAGALIDPFPVYHDAADPCGFIFADPSYEGPVFAFATDLGQVDAGMMNACCGATSIFIEANYSERLMLDDRVRPWRVRERITSRNGHLSNEQAARAIAELPNLRKAILGHLSATTNCPAGARNAVLEATAGSDLEIEVAWTPESERCNPPQRIEIL